MECSESCKLKGVLISSHIGRHTFRTLKFLKGMAAQDIMVISGHKMEKLFMR
jgi:integrase